MMTERFNNNQWFQDLDKRQQQEVYFAVMYAEHFTHGTDGHHRLMLITELAEQLEDYEKTIRSLRILNDGD